MYGLEAITYHNGWAMAVAGVIIVFAGLVVLSATIAQFHKLLNFWEDKGLYYQRLSNRRTQNKTTDALMHDVEISPALRVSIRQYKLITSKIGEPFSLPKLVKLAALSGLPHPYSAINDFVKTGLIAPDGTGYFRWKE